MIKKRVVPVLLLKGERMVKGVQFGNFRDVGAPVTAARVYDAQRADELVFLDIVATKEGKGTRFDIIKQAADSCFIPLTAGGGVKNIQGIKKLLEAGADKVSINTAAVENPGLISAAAKKFGSQCVVVSIDAKGGKVFTRSGTRETGLDPVEWAKEAEERGAGEILLTSIGQEGTMQGYDLALTKKITGSVSIPVIANGGAGKLDHFLEAFTVANASAVAASSIFHFTDQSPMMVKGYLQAHGIDVREL
jgi:cyclase